MFKVKQILPLVVMTAALVAAVARPARATTINPDLTVLAAPFTWDGLNFSSSCFSCGFSWTTPAGGFGGFSIGDVQLGWNGSTGTFFVNDLAGGSGIFGILLAGTVTSFSPSVTPPIGLFSGTLALTTTNLSFGDEATFQFASTDFEAASPQEGTADLDVITAVPEPTSLALLGLGSAMIAAKLRRARTGRTSH